MAFRLVLNGRPLPGQSIDSIQQRLQTQLKLRPDQAKALLPPSTRVVKSGLAQEEAERWLARLRAVGLDARIEAMGQPATAAGDPLVVLETLAKNGLSRSRPSLGYVSQLLLVTLCCLLIPLLYLGLIGVLAAALGWYLTHLHLYLGKLHNIWLLLVLYGVPALSGGILVLFLARPFFQRAPAESDPLCLDPKQEARLQQVIDHLCRAVGIQPPVAVALSNKVNASVHFQNGWSGFFSGRKVLTIGLPLVAGMTVQQFVGVLAHEFGHFAQRLGMRCSFLINRVNAWLYRRGHYRDPWDERLEKWLEDDPDWPWQLAIWVAQRGINLSRALLRGCLELSFRLSRSLSRQREFDADRYEALVAGSKAFRGSSLRLRALSYAWQEVDRRNANTWREGKLLRDMAEATAAQVEQLDKAVLQRLEQNLAEETTRYWDTHPADLDRIQHAESLHAPGHLHDQRPAASLFNDFASHCQRITRAYYADLGLDYQNTQLQDSQQLLQLNAKREEALDQLWEWTGRQWRGLPWLTLHLPTQEAHRALGWQAAIDELRQQSPEISQAWEQAEQLEYRRDELARCVAVQRYGVEPWVDDEEVYDAPRHLPEYRQIEEGSRPAQLQLRNAASLYRRRLECSLAGAAKEQREKARLLLQVSAQYPDYARVLEARLLAQRFLEAYRQQPSELRDKLSQDALLRYQELSLHLLKKCDGIPQDLLEGATLGGYLRQRRPRLNAAAGEPLEFFNDSYGMVDDLCYAYRRVLAEVAEFCLQQERARGIRGIRLLGEIALPA